MRIGLTIFLLLVDAVVDWVLGAIVLFDLFWTFVTKLPPSREIRAFGNRVVAFKYKIGRYMTYNESRPPFPFGDFPEALEPDEFDPTHRSDGELGIPREILERRRRERAERRERRHRDREEDEA